MDEVTIELLQEVSKNAEMGKNTVAKLLELTDDASMCEHLQKQLDTYDDLSRRAHAMLAVRGVLPKEQNPVTKWSAQMGIRMQTMAGASAQKLAEMVIEGSHMGSTELTKALHAAEGANVGALALAERLQTAEEQYADDMTRFL